MIICPEGDYGPPPHHLFTRAQVGKWQRIPSAFNSDTRRSGEGALSSASTNFSLFASRVTASCALRNGNPQPISKRARSTGFAMAPLRSRISVPVLPVDILTRYRRVLTRSTDTCTRHQIGYCFLEVSAKIQRATVYDFRRSSIVFLSMSLQTTLCVFLKNPSRAFRIPKSQRCPNPFPQVFSC